PGAAGLDEGHELALVVGGAPGADGAGPVGEGDENGLEGIALPQLERVGGLDVVMAVEEGGGALPLAAVGEDDRLAGGVVDAGLEAEAAQVSRVEPGAGTAVGGMGGIGGDRAEAEGREKPLERRIEIGIEAGKDAVEVGHRLSPEGIRGARHLAEGRRPGPARGSRLASLRLEPMVVFWVFPGEERR